MKHLRHAAACDDAPEASGDCRCLCGNLLARLVPGGVELKCRRCKRTLLVPVEAGSAAMAAQTVLDVSPVRQVG